MDHERDTGQNLPYKLCSCGKAFAPYRPYQRFCSEACRNKFWLTHTNYVPTKVVEKSCKQCGAMFKTNDGKRKYCSKACLEVHEKNRRKEPEERVCIICGKRFETTHWSKRYCSRHCREEAHRGV